MAFTTTQLAAIESAIASGSLEVTYEGKTVKYASMDDLQKRYNFIRSKLIAQGDIANDRIRTSYVSHSKD